jgi:hypothetical protein
VSLGDVTEVLLRPATGEDYGWSEPCYVELAAQSGTSHVVCKPQSPALEPFHLHVRAEIESEDGVSVRFTVHPPVVVCNQLPAALALAVHAADRRVGAYAVNPGWWPRGRADSLCPGGGRRIGTSVNVHDLPVQGSKSFVSLRLKNSDWTRLVRVDVKKVVLSAPRMDARRGVEGVESGGKREEAITLNVRDGDGASAALLAAR